MTDADKFAAQDTAHDLCEENCGKTILGVECPVSKHSMFSRCERLVENEVYCHVGGLIQELDNATGNQWTLDNIFLEVPYPTDEQVRQYWEDNATPEEDRDMVSAMDEIRDQFDPMEYWAVSNWLMRKLKDEGEVVIEVGLTNVWARCTSGQSICIDYVIEKICKDTGYASGGAE